MKKNLILSLKFFIKMSFYEMKFLIHKRKNNVINLTAKYRNLIMRHT